MAGERTPDDGDIHAAIDDRIHDLGRRMRPTIIAVNRESDDVAHDAAIREGMDRRRVDAVVADKLNADLQRAEARIVERTNIEMSVTARYKDVRGAIVGA